MQGQIPERLTAREQIMEHMSVRIYILLIKMSSAARPFLGFLRDDATVSDSLLSPYGAGDEMWQISINLGGPNPTPGSTTNRQYSNY